ncbi:ABC transporter substrate-binding protein [Nakamurella sp.]|uniref:ABC transporter substrate-binding protein n=1 Tax=Nakamurella sp. TaxID=1869182 RepID=UPI003B3A6699
MRVHRRFGVALGLCCALVVSACGSSNAGPAAGSTASAAAAPTAPVTTTIDTTFGTVAVPTEPTAALGFYTTDLDMLITLGYRLAKEQPIRDDYSAFPSFFPKDALAGITGFHNYPEFNFEKVLAVGPDFILNGLGYAEELHQRLSDIAPTYTYNAFAENADWRDSFRQLSADLGRSQQYQAWVDRYQARIDEVRGKLAAAGVHPVVADVSYWDGQVNLGCYGVPCLVFADLGLEISPLGDSDGDGKSDTTGRTFTLEQLGELSTVDVMFSQGSPAADGSITGTVVDEPTVAANSIWQGLPAVRAGAVHPYDYEMIYGSPSGQLAFLDVVEQALLG